MASLRSTQVYIPNVVPCDHAEKTSVLSCASIRIYLALFCTLVAHGFICVLFTFSSAAAIPAKLQRGQGG